MTESKNTNVEKDGTVNNKKEKNKTNTKAEEMKKNTEPSKSERLEKMEGKFLEIEERLKRIKSKLDLIEDGLLILVHSSQWHNLSITPVGTHDPSTKIKGFKNFQEAIEVLTPEDDEDIVQ